MKKLNLGSGEFPKEGFVNVDWRSSADVKHDLNSVPYPFPDNTFDSVEADHVLEHLNNPFLIMREVHRITKPNGSVKIRVPHFSRGFVHPEHSHGFGASFPLYLDPSFKGDYLGTHYELKEMRFSWFAQIYLKRITLGTFQFYAGYVLGVVFSFLANLSPYFCDRIWCFWVGGFEEIYYDFVCKKQGDE